MNDPQHFRQAAAHLRGIHRDLPGGRGISRRDALRLGGMLAGGVPLLAACGTVPGPPDQGATQKRGGTLSHGATGGDLTDTIDPHFPVTNPDIARVNNLYEPLFFWDDKYELQPALALAITPNKAATEWTIELREGVTFHHGKTMTAEDVMFTIQRVTDPKKPAPGASELVRLLDMKNSRILDDQTIKLVLKQPYSILDQVFAEYTLGIVPTDFDLKNPVGTCAFKYDTFTPGTLSTFKRFDDYWGDSAWVDELVIYDFADDAAKVNALLAGQVQTVDNLPSYLVDSVAKQGSSAMISDSGAWVPFTIRVDTEPFKDVRVRQAMRILVDRQQMIDQALNGFGYLGNDLYAPFDADYAKDIPQQVQDIDKAKSLLKAAGQSDLQIELVTSSAVGAGGVESANLYVDQARKAGVSVRLTNAGNSFYGDQYLKWPFAQDFWNTRNYIAQTASCSLKSSPYNETHFDDAEFVQLFEQATKETDEAKRGDLLHRCQEIQFEKTGYIIWGFKKQVDGYSNLVQGMQPSRYLPCGSFKFQRVSFV